MICLNKIYNESCLDTLSRMEDDSIDLVVTSPPYNMNLRIRNGKYCSRQVVKEFSSKYNGFSDNIPIDDFYEFHLKVIRELLRTSSIIFYNIQIVTGSKRAFFKIIGELNEYLKDIVIWDKCKSQPAMAQGVLNRQSELIFIFEKSNAISRQFKKCNFERGTLNDIWQIRSGGKGKDLKGHSAVFPEALVEKIIMNFTDENDVVYDPFMGAGTTGVVCKKLNRNFIGSELVSDYVELSNNRINSILV